MPTRGGPGAQHLTTMDPETAAMTGDADPEVYDSLDGQVALVTGATRGIGAEIAARLADLGATV